MQVQEGSLPDGQAGGGAGGACERRPFAQVCCAMKFLLRWWLLIELSSQPWILDKLRVVGLLHLCLMFDLFCCRVMPSEALMPLTSLR